MGMNNVKTSLRGIKMTVLHQHLVYNTFISHVQLIVFKSVDISQYCQANSYACTHCNIIITFEQLYKCHVSVTITSLKLTL